MSCDAEIHDGLLDAGRELPESCCVCTGDEDAPPCSEACDAVVRRAKRIANVRAYYRASRRAIELARQYRAEGDTATSMRLYGALKAVRFYRAQIQLTRASQLADVPVTATEERNAAQ